MVCNGLRAASNLCEEEERKSGASWLLMSWERDGGDLKGLLHLCMKSPSDEVSIWRMLPWRQRPLPQQRV